VLVRVRDRLDNAVNYANISLELHRFTHDLESLSICGGGLSRRCLHFGLPNIFPPKRNGTWFTRNANGTSHASCGLAPALSQSAHFIAQRTDRSLLPCAAPASHTINPGLSMHVGVRRGSEAARRVRCVGRRRQRGRR